jgi:hypothetical protein
MEGEPIYTVAAMPQASPAPFRRTPMIMSLIAVFLLPIMARAGLYTLGDGPRSWREADWSSVGSLPPARDHPQARVLVLSGRTGGLKGVVSVHSWIVVKPENATSWSRYDVVGWGIPLRLNGWAADGRWYGNNPEVVADLSGEAAQRLIARITDAIRNYQYRHAGDYRLWPGPNSNTFVATILRAVPELGVTLPPNAVGRDYRSQPYFGISDSGTGVEANLWGMLGIKLGWVEGIEINLFGLVAGLDLRHPALKLPGFGRIALDAFLPAQASAGSR